MPVRRVDADDVHAHLEGFWTRSSQSETLTAAPTRSLPRASLQALGYFVIFRMSLIVMSPLRLFRPSTTRASRSGSDGGSPGPVRASSPRAR